MNSMEYEVLRAAARTIGTLAETHAACKASLMQEGALAALQGSLSSTDDELAEAGVLATLSLAADVGDFEHEWSMIAREIVSSLAPLVSSSLPDVRRGTIKILTLLSQNSFTKMSMLDCIQGRAFPFVALFKQDDFVACGKAAIFMGHTSEKALPVLQRAIEQAGWADVLAADIVTPRDAALQDQCMAQLERLIDNCKGVREKVLVAQPTLPEKLRALLADANENVQMRAASLLLALGPSDAFTEADTRLQSLAKSASLPVGQAANTALQKVAQRAARAAAQLLQQQQAAAQQAADDAAAAADGSDGRSRGGRVAGRSGAPAPMRGSSGSDKSQSLPASFKLSQRHQVGFAEMIGRRNTMEDVSVVHGRFRDRDDEDLYAVFDGHGGREVAEFTSAKFANALTARLAADPSRDPLDVLKETFLDLNDQMAPHPWARNCGTTAAVVLLQQSVLYVANVGDTRAVLARSGHAVRLTVDHKPSLPEETARITERGGFVKFKRVNGVLAVSRALGDHSLQPHVSAEPHLARMDLQANDQFLVLACDGVWDVLSDEAACELVAAQPDAQHAAQALRDKAYALGSTDNISVVIIYLNKPPPVAPEAPPPIIIGPPISAGHTDSTNVDAPASPAPAQQ